MTAQPIAPVPTATQAPPAPQAGGQGPGAFSNYLDTDGTNAIPGQGSTKTGFHTHGSALRWHKASTKRSDAGNDNSAASGQANTQLAAASQPLAPAPKPANDSNQPNSTNRATGADASLSAATAILGREQTASPGSSPAGSASAKGSGLPLGATLGGLLGAGSSISLLGNPNTSRTLEGHHNSATLLTNRPALPPGLLAQTQGAGSSAANSAALPVLPNAAGTPADAPQGATFASSHFGAPGATANSNLALAAAAARLAAAQNGAPSAKSDASSNGGAGANGAGGARSVASIQGAADLNARIVTAATNLTAHPNQAATATAAALMQPKNANAGAMPPGTANPALGAKTPAAGIAPPSGDGTDAAGNRATSANPATDPRNLVAALDRAPAVSKDAAATLTGNPQSQSDGSSDGGPGSGNGASSNAALLAAPQGANATAPAAPAIDAGIRPAVAMLPVAEQIAVNVKQALTTGANEIQIQLKPDSLGVIDVKLNVNHDGRLTAVISANRSDTLNLLKQDASNLQQSLRDAGFNADSGSLSFNLNSNTQSFAQNTPQPSPTPSLSSSFAGVPSVAAPARASRQHLGTVDLHV